MQTFRNWSGLIWSCALMGCARGPDVESDLPLRRVVVYRNGVGYFERRGQVDEERVAFKMKAKMVGDFLATLAIVERGGSTVRSASFPLDIEDKKALNDPPRELERMLKPWPPPEPPKSSDDLREVVLHLDGKEHDLSIGYVAETPVWRPSYRLVVTGSNQANLQAWGIVQNLSGEDWRDVELSLVAGAPIAFQSTLGDPVVPERPVVTDSGEVIVAVPEAVTSLSEGADTTGDREAEAGASPEPEEEAIADEDAEGYSFEERDGMRKPSPSMPMRKRAAAQSAPAGGAPPPPPQAPRPAPMTSEPRSMSALAAVAVEGGTTQYVLPNRVTVPNESATMVLLMNRPVPGEVVFLFSPDGGVSDSTVHPFRVARFANSTNGLLEKGPIAVFEKGSFLGEGMLDPLPPKAKATVPFALERGLAVQKQIDFELLGARLARIEASNLFINRDRSQRTTYRVKNGTRDAARVLVKHPRLGDARLHEPPEGTEDNIGSGYALVPTTVAAHQTGKLVVDERSEYIEHADWLSELADLAIKEYLSDRSADPKQQAALRAAWEIRTKLQQARDEQSRLRHEQEEHEKAARETRLSLQAIEGNKQATDLRQKLTVRLRDIGNRMDELTKRLVEVKMAVDEQQVRFRDAIRDISVQRGPPAP